MPDELDELIEQAREELWSAVEAADRAALKRDLAKSRVEALELAARLRPPRTAGPVLAQNGAKGRGRQPGAISKQWRSILLEVAHQFPEGATEDAIAIIAKRFGLENTRPKDVLDRMKVYETHSYIESTPNGWRVTSTATEKFKVEKDTADSTMESAA